MKHRAPRLTPLLAPPRPAARLDRAGASSRARVAARQQPTRAERKAEKAGDPEAPAASTGVRSRGGAADLRPGAQTFLALDEDYQRDAFIKKFWGSRDPYQHDPQRASGRWERRSRKRARSSAPSGRPLPLPAAQRPAGGSRRHPLRRVPGRRGLVLRPRATARARSWCSSSTSTSAPGPTASGSRRRAWRRSSPTAAPSAPWPAPGQQATTSACRDGYRRVRGRPARLRLHLRQGQLAYPLLLMKAEQPIEQPSGEWLSTFASYSTECRATPPLPRHARLRLPRPAAEPHRDAGHREGADRRRRPRRPRRRAAYNLLLTGEVLRGDQLFDRFRYKFDFPAAQVGTPDLPLVFQRRCVPATTAWWSRSRTSTARSSSAR